MSGFKKAVNRVALVAVVSLSAVGCGPSYDAEQASGFERAALTVDRVVSAEFEFGGSFGASHQEGLITLEAETQEDATPIIEDIYRTFAGDLSIDGADSPVIEFEAADSGESFDDADLNFGGIPSVSQMRERYCGDMECESGVTK